VTLIESLASAPRRLVNAAKRAVFAAEMSEADSRFKEWMRKANASRVNPPRRGTAEAIEFFKVSPMLRAAGQLIANSVASTRFRAMMPTRADGQPIRNAPAEWYRLRSEPPGPERTAAIRRMELKGLCKDTFRIEQMAAEGQAGKVVPLPFSRILSHNLPGYDGRTLIMQAELHRIVTGEMAILTATDGSTNPLTGRATPVAGMAIPPTWIIETPRADSPYFRVSRGALQEKIPEDRIAWHRQPDLADPFARGVGAVSTLATELEIDEEAAGVIREWMQAGAQGGTIINLPGATDLGKLEEAWKKAKRNRQKGIPFFTAASAEMTVRELQNQNALAQTSAIRREQFDFVRAYFGLPPELFGILANSNRSTIDAAWEIFCRVCLIPELEVWRIFLQGFCDYYFGEGIYLIDYPSPIPENRELLLTAAEKFPEAIQLGEVRTRIMGLPAFGDKRDQLAILRPGVQLTQDLLAQADQPDSEPEPQVGEDEEGDE
jgi:hypothetical protein